MQELCWRPARATRAITISETASVRGNVNRRFNICRLWIMLTLVLPRWTSVMARILLVEDDADVQLIISEFLGTSGHCVVPAASAEQARLFLANQPIDVAVIDCLMSGEQGDSLAEHASQLGIPTILTSSDPHYLETLPGHPLPFLPKPFRLAALGDLILQLLPPSDPPVVR